MGIAAISGVALTAAWIRRRAQRLLGEKESLISSWRFVESVIVKRNAILPDLIQAIEEKLPAERERLSELSTWRDDSERQLLEGDIKRLSDTEKAILENVREIKRLIESSKELSADPELSPIANQMAEMEERLRAQREQYNIAVNRFNQTLRRFPNGAVASFLRLKEREYLEARRYSR